MGARLLLLVAVLLAALTSIRLGEYRALRPPKPLPGSADRPTLLFLFQPGDCARYGGLVDRWSELDGTHALRVIGLGIGFSSPPTRADSLFGGRRPSFEVRYDLPIEAQRLLARIGHGQTPTSVLLDRAGRPVFILPPTADSAKQAEAAGLIARYVTGVAGEAR